jgi:peptidoglycan/LPS O-acetylase OafA/YrhL
MSAKRRAEPEIAIPSVEIMPTGERRIGALTGIRWWAAFGVLLSHSIPGGDTPRIIQSFFEQGNLGVTVFFVLSGFILTYTYSETLVEPTGRKIWSFYVARVARVYPLYLLVLLWVTPRKIATYGAPIDESWFTHLFGIQAWFRLPVAWDWNGPAWSVSVEFFFYALFPLLLILARPLLGSTRKAYVFAAIGLAAVIAESVLAEPIGWTSDGTATVFPPLRLCDFLLGMGVGAIFLRSRLTPRLARWGLALLGVWLIWTLGVIWLRSFYYGVPGLNIAYAIPAAALILGLAWTPHLVTTRWLANRPMIVLGEASYAFYLIHMSVGADLFVGLFSNGFGNKAIVLWVLGVTFLIAMSIGLNIMVETPARRFLRRWLAPRKEAAQDSSAGVGPVGPGAEAPADPSTKVADDSRESGVERSR